MKIPTANFRYACDLDEEKLSALKTEHPRISITTSYEKILADKETQAIIIATPVRTHFPLARQALERGKHVLVEKPMTHSRSDAQQLILLANKNKRMLCVDHTFIYTPAVQYMKKLVTTGELGKLFYFDSVRVNLGLFQNDTNVLWDLAAHDFAIMDYVLGIDPIEISAIGASHVRKGTHNIVYVTVKYPNDLLGHIHVNWLAPAKLRSTILSGYHKMVTYNDLEPVEKIKIYDRSITYTPNLTNINLSKYQYRVGDIHSPRLDDVEALRVLCEHFINAIQTKRKLRTDGNAGYRVVSMLEYAQQSLDNGGKAIPFIL